MLSGLVLLGLVLVGTYLFQRLALARSRAGIATTWVLASVLVVGGAVVLPWLYLSQDSGTGEPGTVEASQIARDQSALPPLVLRFSGREGVRGQSGTRINFTWHTVFGVDYGETVVETGGGTVTHWHPAAFVTAWVILAATLGTISLGGAMALRRLQTGIDFRKGASRHGRVVFHAGRR